LFKTIFGKNMFTGRRQKYQNASSHHIQTSGVIPSPPQFSGKPSQ